MENRHNQYLGLFDSPEVITEAHVIDPTKVKYYVGIDNGVSGSIAVLSPDGYIFFQAVPTKNELNYTKDKKRITRIDFTALITLLKTNIPPGHPAIILIERPMVNPKRFFATVSALRALESVLNAVDDVLHYPFQYIDSRLWQKELLPGVKGTDELKAASFDIGNRLFPKYRDYNHNDRDSLLMAEYARRKNL